MTRRKTREDIEERARRKLAKAQAEFQVAQERRTLSRTKGEHMVERARERAARQLTKATKRVERRAGIVARAEARLMALQRRASAKGAGQAQRIVSDTGIIAVEGAFPGAEEPASLRSLEAGEGRTLDGVEVVPDGPAGPLSDENLRVDGESGQRL